MLGLPISMASLAVEPGSRCTGFSGLQSTGSIVVALGHGLSCSVACGILPDQGLKLCLLHDRQCLYHEPAGKLHGTSFEDVLYLQLPVTAKTKQNKKT